MSGNNSTLTRRQRVPVRCATSSSIFASNMIRPLDSQAPVSLLGNKRDTPTQSDRATSAKQKCRFESEISVDSSVCTLSDDEFETDSRDEAEDCVFMDTDTICLDKGTRSSLRKGSPRSSDVRGDMPLDLRNKLSVRLCEYIPEGGSTRKQGSRRVYTNSRERWRQQTVNSAFSELRRFLPTHPPDKKLCKSEILKCAIKYIRLLSDVVEYQENNGVNTSTPGRTQVRATNLVASTIRRVDSETMDIAASNLSTSSDMSSPEYYRDTYYCDDD